MSDNLGIMAVRNNMLRSSSILILVLVIFPSCLAVDKCVENNEGYYPIIDVTQYIEGIFVNDSSESRELLRKLLKEEMSPTLFYATDYDRNILRTLNETFIEVVKWIAEADSSNSVNMKRQILLALRPTRVFNLSVSSDYHLLPKEVLQVVSDTLARIVIDFEASCDKIDVLLGNNSDHFIIQINNDLSALRKWKEVSVGVGNSFGCIIPFSNKINTAEFTLPTITFTNEAEFLLSYTFLMQLVDRLTSSLGNESTLMMRIKLLPQNGSFNEQFRSFQNLGWEYAARWQEESKCRVVLTMINEYEPSVMLPSTKQSRRELISWNYTSRNVIPFLFLDEIFDSKVSTRIGWRLAQDCLDRDLVKIATKFDTLLMDFDTWREMITPSGESNRLESLLFRRREIYRIYVTGERCEQYHNSHKPTNILLLVNLKKCRNSSCNSLEQVFEILENGSKIRGMAVKSVIFNFGDGENMHDRKFATNLTGSFSGITFGCFSQFATRISPFGRRSIPPITAPTCQLSFLKGDSVSIWEFNIYPPNDYVASSEIERTLRDILNTVLNLKKLEPRKEVIIKFVIQTEDPKWNTTYHLFCDKTVSQAQMLSEALTMWASIHKIKVILKPAFDTSKQVGWWSKASGDGNYVARSYPPNSNFGSDPCIPWTQVATEKISLNRTESSVLGISVDMGIKKYTPGKPPMSLEELEMMTLFALHVSPTIEILTRGGNPEDTVADIETIREMIVDSKFGDTLRLNNITNGSLFIRIPGDSLISSAAVLQRLLEAASRERMLTTEGVHIRYLSPGFFTFTVEKSTHIIANVSKLTQFGITIRNCDIIRLLHSRNSSFSEIIWKSSYIVCGNRIKLETRTTSSEKERLQDFLDFQLGIKKHLLSFLPNLKKVFFRDNLDRVEQLEYPSLTASRYLKYMSLLNEYRNSYNISLFVSGFDREVKSKTNNNFETGWWTISNYSDLTNRSVYSGKQSLYFHQSSWKPILEEDTEANTTEETSIGIALSLPIALISLGAVALVSLFSVSYIIILRRKMQFLTDKEVREFFEGASADDTSPLMNPTEHGYLYQGFRDGFEIPKAELNPGDRRLLGTGNFGLVYEAEARGCRVAVKVPHDNCSKETFRSMLFEVKVLSYLGIHENVIEFVGCYTKEIQSGVIFIATKLCERGSLLNHLIRELRNEDEFTLEDRLRELVRFSLQIASGMEYISGKHIVHGDLATRNVLLDGDLTCKIGDFGLSRKVYEYGKYVKKNQEPLPWRWMAYETLVDMEFTSQSDVWSFGVTLWEIFSLGATPYPGLSWSVEFTSDLRKGLRLGSPQYATETMYLTMRTCWNLDAATRPNFKELREIFQEIRNQQIYSEID